MLPPHFLMHRLESMHKISSEWDVSTFAWKRISSKPFQFSFSERWNSIDYYITTFYLFSLLVYPNGKYYNRSIATNGITHLKFESWIVGIRIKLQLLQLILWRHICYKLLIENFLIEWKNRCCMKSKLLNLKMSQNYLPQWSVFSMMDPADPSLAYKACCKWANIFCHANFANVIFVF